MYTKILFSMLLSAAIVGSAEEFQLARVKVQRVADEEYLTGFSNDKDELTYSINATGEASLWISPDGVTTKRVTDPNYIHHYSPYVIPDNYYNFTWTSSYEQGEVISDKPGVYSLLNSKSGNKWVNYVSQGTVWANQTNILYCYVDQHYNIYDCKYEYRGENPSMNIDNENHCVTFKITPTGKWPPPIGGTPTMSCIVSNIVIYSVEKLEDTIVDVRMNDVKFKDRDGVFSMNGLRGWVKGLHDVQNRWFYYPATNDVQIGSQRLKFGTQSFMKGGQSIEIYALGNKMIEVTGGVSTNGWKIGGIEVKDDVVTLYVDSAVNQKVSVKRAVNNVEGPYVVLTGSQYTDTYPNTVIYKGVDSYKIDIPVTSGAQSEFYTLSVNSTEPVIGLYADKFKIGSNEAEYTKVQITDKNGVVWEVLGRRVSP